MTPARLSKNADTYNVEADPIFRTFMATELHDTWMLIISFSQSVGKQFLAVLSYPLSPATRIFYLYLATSLLLAIVVYSKDQSQKNAPAPEKTLFRFLFPEQVWSNSSAWLDVRYFFFHQMLRLVIYGVFMSFISAAVFQYLSEWFGSISAEPPTLQLSSFTLVEVLYVLISAAALDFVAFAMHYLQHKVPVLWEFHKVHHSATVMHPLTNYREHPVDNLFYAIGTGVTLGILTSVISVLIGYVPEVPTVFGISIFVFAFNILGYNLRHSHIWLRWPGRLSYLFGSPAHHQVHHSYFQEHIDKNFAFTFPIWDLIFGTYCVPETNKDVRFGLSENQESEYQSCLDLYIVPIKSAFLYLFPRLERN